MLTGKQRSYLKGLAHNMRPVLQVGKDGITTAFIEQVRETIEKRELIKITLLESVDEDAKTAGNIIAERSGAEFVQAVGRKVVIYKANKEKPQIELPKVKKKK